MLKNSKNVFKFLLFTAIAVLGFLILRLVAAFFINIFFYPDFDEHTLKYEKQIDIRALKDNTVYVVGKASSDVSQNFYYLEERNGKFYSDYQSATDSALVESDEKPHIKVYSKVPKEISKLYTWSENIVDFSNKRYFYEFYIPEGSIEMEFEVDQE